MTPGCLPGKQTPANLPRGAVAQNPFLVAQIPLLKALVAWPPGVETRFWTVAKFCRNFNTISMANSPAHGKSEGGPHGRLPVALLSRLEKLFVVQLW